MKKLVGYFLQYPIAVNTLLAALVIFGWLGMRKINSTFFPVVESRIIAIEAVLPGASPEEVEEGIVQKVEENLKGTSGVERVTSVSSENAAQILVEVFKGQDADRVLEDVRNAVSRVPSFPVGMEPIRVFLRENITFTLSFSISGQDLELGALKALGRSVEEELRRLPGLSKVELKGFPEEEVEILLSEPLMRAQGIGFDQVAQALRAENIDVSAGTVKNQSEELSIRARNKGDLAYEFHDIPIRTDALGGRLVLGDIATVRDRFADRPTGIKVNGQPAVLVMVSNTDEEDMLQTAADVRDFVEGFRTMHPELQVKVIQDASVTLEQRRQLLINNGIAGFLLVLAFLALFLNVRIAFWVALGIPFSFLAMFILAGFFGITINVISLFGMIVVVGILVDDGIVISENIYQHYERGASPIQAALDGTFEVLPSVLSSVLTTIVAFSTFFFLDGRAGDFFSQLSLIVILTLAVSLIEATLFLPSHLAHSKALRIHHRSRLELRMDEVMNAVRARLYLPVLRFLLRHRFFALMLPVGMLLLTLGAFQGQIIKATFFPFIERDNIEINLSLPSGTREEVTWEVLENIYRRSMDVNERYNAERLDGLSLMQDVSLEVGPTGNRGRININLLDAERRGTKSFEVSNAIREAVGPIPGADNLTYGNASAFGRPVSISLLGTDPVQLEKAKNELKAHMNSLSALEDVTDSDLEGPKEILVSLKPQAALLGFTTRSLLEQVRQGFFGLEVQRLQRGRDEVKVWLRYDEADRDNLYALEDMRVRGSNGQLIALRDLADIEIERGVVGISHLDGAREIKVEAELSNPSESAPALIAAIREGFIDVQLLPRYPGIRALYEGQNREAMKTAGSAQKVVPYILIAMILIITFTFRSLIQTMVVFLLIPLTLTGVAWGHFFHGMPMSIFSYLGIIALIGILVNDSLVFVSTFNERIKSGMNLYEALEETGGSRFRAIFLTTATTVAGLAPLILERSFQAQFLVPMAISVAYGILYATLLTLFTLPVLLSFANDARRGWTWLWTGVFPQPETVEPAMVEKNAEAYETPGGDA
ncbi:MMPL family transporter [bacterium]|nr:MMPL family transporter [bacterium]